MDFPCLPSEFFLAKAVSATESSDRLAFIGLPLLVTSASRGKIQLNHTHQKGISVGRLSACCEKKVESGYQPRFSTELLISFVGLGH